eukprot:510918-Pyramimonas_sp.AAC.1
MLGANWHLDVVVDAIEEDSVGAGIARISLGASSKTWAELLDACSGPPWAARPARSNRMSCYVARVVLSVSCAVRSHGDKRGPG